MSPNLDEVLTSLYYAQRENICEGGWINTFELLDDIAHQAAFPLITRTELLEALEELRLRELVEYDVGLPDFWRLSQRFYADLDEWCQRVLESLHEHPEWHHVSEIRGLVEKTKHMTVPPAPVFAPVLRHLDEEYHGVIEFSMGRVRIRLSEWLKRCSTQAPSS